MGFFFALLCMTVFAKQPLQPVVVDGDNYEWRLLSVSPQSLTIGEARSFITGNFLYVSIETDKAQNQISLHRDNVRMQLDIKSNSGSIRIGNHSIRFPFFDGILGIESAIKENTVEIRAPSLGSGQIMLQIAGQKTRLQPGELLGNNLPAPHVPGKLNSIIQQESAGELHIRLLEEQVSPLNVVQSVINKDYQQAEDLLEQIAESDQRHLKPWALISLAEMVVWNRSDLERSRMLRQQAVRLLDAIPSVAHIQESVRQKWQLKSDPVEIINSIGDLSLVNDETRYRVGQLWYSVGNYSEAEKVFEDLTDTYYSQRAKWQLSQEGYKDNGQLYATYRLLSKERFGEVALLYAQARKTQSDYFHALVRMLHRHEWYNPVFVEYMKIR